MFDMTDKILVVVDAEPGYRKDMTAGVLDTIEMLVRAAVRADSYIIFLEFCDRGTLTRLLRCVRRYDGWVCQSKQRADGSTEVLDACRRAGVEPLTSFVICGVDTNTCVAATAGQLAAKMPEAQIEVVQDGCGSRDGNRWDVFPRTRNLRRVRLQQAVAS
jgi:nicotinamidase-related amidase